MQKAATAKEICGVLADASMEELPALCERYADDPRTQVKSAVARACRRMEREASEHERVSAMYELQAELGGTGVVLGVDEVGRGALAGPLTVCAVALPAEPRVWGINDSKQLTPARREVLSQEIAATATAIGIAHIEPAAIDATGMAVCIKVAMAEAIRDAGIEPDAVLIDGNPVRVHPREKTVVHGDARVACIAAASIVAKVTRDELMVSLDAEYPGYHLAESKGYGSPQHIQAIRERGITPIHRMSFCGNFLETPRLF